MLLLNFERFKDVFKILSIAVLEAEIGSFIIYLLSTAPFTLPFFFNDSWSIRIQSLKKATCVKNFFILFNFYPGLQDNSITYLIWYILQLRNNPVKIFFFFCCFFYQNKKKNWNKKEKENIFPKNSIHRTTFIVYLILFTEFHALVLQKRSNLSWLTSNFQNRLTTD